MTQAYGRDSEDVLDVGRRESPEMVCEMCGAQFSAWLDTEDFEEHALTADVDECPACGSTQVRRQ